MYFPNGTSNMYSPGDVKNDGSRVNMIGFRAAHGGDAISGSVPVRGEEC